MSDCRFAEDVVARALGELEPARAGEVARHLEACAACRALDGDLLRMKRTLAARTGRRARGFARIAAGLAVGALVAVVWAFGRGAPAPDSAGGTARMEAAAWLVEQLAPEGTWAPSGPALEHVSRHALGLLALATVEAEAPDADREEALRRGAAWLVARQDAAGDFDADARSATFAQPLATLALAECWAATGDDSLRAPAARALARLDARLVGWTRTRADVPGPAAWAAWGIQALERGRALGLLEAPSPPTLALRELPAPAIATRAGNAGARPGAVRAVALGLDRRTHPQLSDPVYGATVAILDPGESAREAR